MSERKANELSDIKSTAEVESTPGDPKKLKENEELFRRREKFRAKEQRHRPSAGS